MKRLLSIAFLTVLLCNCQTPEKPGEPRTDDSPINTEGFTGFCRSNGAECEVSCASRNLCFGKLEPELCKEKDPTGGEYACYRRDAASGPKGPPGDAKDWNGPQCFPTANECGQANCRTQIFFEFDTGRCSDEVNYAPWACYCKIGEPEEN